MTTAKPSGAMSLLDKYASLNSSIEDARKRVASTRANLDTTTAKIQDLRENRAEMLQQIDEANADASKLKEELEKYTLEQRAKLAEKKCVEREEAMAKRAYNDTKNLIEKERREFLERCHEFRASCKKIRSAASILVLDGGGGNFDARDASDEIDLWRKLQEEDLSDDKKIDTELKDAEMEEKESRQNHIEAECLLHSTIGEHQTATQRGSSRRMKLSQQRAQLERHRKEVEELEREIDHIKDEVVEANVMANTFETECQRRKQIRHTNTQASHSNDFISSSHESNVTNPYRRSYQPTNNAPVSNPYKRAITPNAPSNSATNNPYQPRSGNRGLPTSSPRYASELLNEVTPRQYGGNNRSSQSNNVHQLPNQQQKGVSRTSRHNRQFGTNVGVSMDSNMSDDLRECMKAFAASDDLSTSSNSSSDDEILSYTFGKK